MKGSELFAIQISSHLQEVAATDPLFAEALKKPAKNINDCVTYILNEVKTSGQNGFGDEEIYNMAIHYYDEDDIKIGNPVSATVKINHHVPAPPKTLANTPTPTKPVTPKPKAKVVEAVVKPVQAVKKIEQKQPVANQISLF